MDILFAFFHLVLMWVLCYTFFSLHILRYSNLWQTVHYIFLRESSPALIRLLARKTSSSDATTRVGPERAKSLVDSLPCQNFLHLSTIAV